MSWTSCVGVLLFGAKIPVTRNAFAIPRKQVGMRWQNFKVSPDQFHVLPSGNQDCPKPARQEEKNTQNLSWSAASDQSREFCLISNRLGWPNGPMQLKLANSCTLTITSRNHISLEEKLSWFGLIHFGFIKKQSSGCVLSMWALAEGGQWSQGPRQNVHCFGISDFAADSFLSGRAAESQDGSFWSHCHRPLLLLLLPLWTWKLNSKLYFFQTVALNTCVDYSGRRNISDKFLASVNTLDVFVQMPFVLCVDLAVQKLEFQLVVNFSLREKIHAVWIGN